jgi:phosphoglycerate dehydrogenase-like enzyme
MPRVVVLNTAEEDYGARRLLGPGWQFEFVPEDAPEAEWVAAFATADAVIGYKLKRRLPTAPRLRLFQVSAAGYDRVELAALPPGCTVANLHGHEIGIAEYVMLGMLEWTIGLRGMDQRLRRGDWAGSAEFIGRTIFHGELAGKTLGIVGFGHIGRETARRASAFGMRIGAITRTPRAAEPLDWAVPLAELDARLPECDFLLLACPLDAATRGLMDRRRLALMKRSSVLINVARGPVAEEDALYEALRDRTIAGAVLDAWYVYPTPAAPNPLPAHRPFHELPNVILSPHASAWTDKLFARRGEVVADNLRRLAEGRELRNVVART